MGYLLFWSKYGAELRGGASPVSYWEVVGSLGLRIRVISREVHSLICLKRNKWKNLYTPCLSLPMCLHFRMAAAFMCQRSGLSSSWVKCRRHCQWHNTYLVAAVGGNLCYNPMDFSYPLPGTAFALSVHWTLHCKSAVRWFCMPLTF